SLRRSCEPSPDPARRRLTGPVHRDAYEPKASIELLRVCLWPPPIGAARLPSGHCIEEANGVVNGVAGYPWASTYMVCEIRRVVAHAADLGNRQFTLCHAPVAEG